MSIKDIVSKREISETLHFTKNPGLTGILHANLVKSRKRLEDDDELMYIFEPNASYRKDKLWLDYVNLSVSEINSQFFSVASKGWHAGTDKWWCILSFHPEVLLHPGVVFSTTNNIYTGVLRSEFARGLEALFSPRVVRWPGNVIFRPEDYPTKIPTCEQAEVLYPGELSTEFLQRIYVQTGEDADDISAQIAATGHPDVPITVNSKKFRGYSALGQAR